MSPTSESREIVAGWGTTFAGTMMMIVGLVEFFQGLVAVINGNQFFVTTPNYVFQFNATTWGWIHLVFGIVVAVAGLFIFTGNIVGAEEYEKAGKAKGDISGITADDATRKITIKIKQPSGQFPFILAMDFAGLVPGDTPFSNETKSPPPGVGPFKITSVQTGRSFVMEKNANYPEIEGLRERDAYPADPEEGYGWEKLFSEKLAQYYREEGRLETRVARFHNVYVACTHDVLPSKVFAKGTDGPGFT